MNNPIYVPKLLPLDFCHFFTHVLLRQSDLAPCGDLQVPNAQAILSHEYMFETLHERIWPLIERITEKELIPTYAYARLYGNNDSLEKHLDRPACEISVTLQLGRSHHYAWPIYMGGERFDLAEGDGVIYSGCEIEHWRDICQGPDNYYAGQLFLHFVQKNGCYATEEGDKNNRDVYSYRKDRTSLMESK